MTLIIIIIVIIIIIIIIIHAGLVTPENEGPIFVHYKLVALCT